MKPIKYLLLLSLTLGLCGVIGCTARDKDDGKNNDDRFAKLDENKDENYRPEDSIELKQGEEKYDNKNDMGAPQQGHAVHPVGKEVIPGIPGPQGPAFEPPGVSPLLADVDIIPGTGSQGATRKARTGNDDDDEKPVCGNGILEYREQCDDGNDVDWDACKKCRINTDECTFVKKLERNYIVCGEDPDKKSQNQIKSVSANTTWQQARDFCQLFGMYDLADRLPEGARKDAASALKEAGVTLAHWGAFENVHDKFETLSGRIIPLDSPAWAPGQPDECTVCLKAQGGLNAMSAGPTNTVRLDEDGLLSDGPASSELPFICQSFRSLIKQPEKKDS